MRSVFRRATPPATSAPAAAETGGGVRTQEREATARRTTAAGRHTALARVMAATSKNQPGEEIEPRDGGR